MNANQTMASIAALLVLDEDSVLADMAGAHSVASLDFTLASVKHVDAFLEQAHLENRRRKRLFGFIPRAADGKIDARLAAHPSFQKFVMRTGAYVGEAMRYAKPECEWIKFDDWIEAHPKDRAVLGDRPDLGTAFMLKVGEGVCFPVGKVLKYIANGSEDSVYSFASVFTELEGKPA